MRITLFKPKLLATALLAFGALSSFGQTLNKDIDVGRNRIGSSTYNGVSGSGESYTVSGGGNDIWSNFDEFHYRYTEFCGDFDVVVRVESLTANQVWSKAGIMVRESLAEDSRMIFERVTPPGVKVCDPGQGNGANDVRLAYRTGLHIAGGFNLDRNDGEHEDAEANALPPNYPTAWLRLTRTGNVFTGFRSDDGINWTQQGQQDTGAGPWVSADGPAVQHLPFKNSVLLGLACSRHSGPPSCMTATAEFRDFKLTPDARFCLASGDSFGCPTKIRLCFSHPVGPDAFDASHYTVDNGVFVNGADPGPTPNTVDLTVDMMTEGTLYTVCVDNISIIHDSAGNAVDQGCLCTTFIHADGYQMAQVHIVINQAPNGWAPDYNSAFPGYVFDTLAYNLGLPVDTDGWPAHTNNAIAFEDSGPTGTPDLGTIETYFARAIGVLQINADGDYRFACSSDDSGALFLSTDDKPVHKVQIAREPQWAGTREWTGPATGEGGRANCLPDNTCENVSAPIHLLSGHSYYLEYLHAEGGGGNHGAVTWDAGSGTLPANGNSPLATDPNDPVWAGKGQLIPVRWYRNEIFYNLGPVAISLQPQSQTIAENDSVCFSVGLDGSPPYTYQWRRNGVPVPGATSSSYCLQAVGAENGVHFSVAVTNGWGGTISDDAILMVVCNPRLTNVTSKGNCHAVYAQYSKAVNLDGVYSLVDSANAPLALGTPKYGSSQNEVCLPVTPDLTPGSSYTLISHDAHSQDNCVQTPNPATNSFVHGAEYKQFHVLYKRYDDVGNGSFNALLAAPKIINDNPDLILTDISGLPAPLFESPSNQRDNFGDRLIGYYQAPQDGDYRFWMSCDDQGATYIAEDAIPAHKHIIAAEAAWGGVRAFTDAGHDNNDNRGTPPVYDPTCNLNGNGSLPIHLAQGQVVYLETLHTEGGGGDNSALTVTINDPAVPANGADPIHADQFLQKLLAPDGTVFSQLCDVSCSVSDQTVFVGQTAVFNAAPDGTPPYAIQWNLNGSPIPGATGAILTTAPVTEANDGDTYSLTISNGWSNSSCSAKVHVRHEPVVVACSTRNDPTHIYVTYNKPVKVDPSGSEYTLSGPDPSVFVNGATYGASHSEVVVATDALQIGTSWTLTILGVQDEEAGNTIVPNPTVCKFAASIGNFCFDFSTGIPACTTVANTSQVTPAPYVGPEGALHLTDQVNSLVNFWQIPLGSLQTFGSLKANWKTLFAGAGGADGFSFNVGKDIGFGFTPEEGAGDGLSVTIDTYDNGGGEVGMEVRWNGARLSFLPIGGGTVNGPPELETGAFVDTSVDVSTTGFVTFTHNTFTTTAQIPGYTGITANQYVFAARTGGANENCWIDDVCINAFPPGPALKINRDNTGHVSLTWDLPYKLQSSGALGPNANWQDVGSGSPYSVQGPGFFRLISP